MLRFQRGPLQPGKRGTKLFVRAAVCSAADRAQEGMQREGHGAVGGRAGFVVASKEFDVDILIEGTRQPITRRRQDAPASSGRGRVGQGGIVGRIAESKERQRFQRSIEENHPRGGSASRGQTHGVQGTGNGEGGIVLAPPPRPTTALGIGNLPPPPTLPLGIGNLLPPPTLPLGIGNREWGIVGMGNGEADSLFPMKSGWGGRGRTASPIPHSRLPIPKGGEVWRGS